MGGALAGKRVLAVLHGVEVFGHELGNIEVFKALREMGAEVCVGVDARPENHVAEALEELGFPTFPLRFGPQWSKKFICWQPSLAVTNFLRVFQCSRRFSRAIREFQPTHIHLGSSLAYSYLSLALVLDRTPLIYRMGDCPPTDSPFNLRIWKMAMRRCSRVACISRFVREAAVGVGVYDSSVIHNFPPVRANNKSAPKWELNDAMGLLYVGQITEAKGVMLLVEAFARVLSQYPDLQLDIAGGSRYDGPFWERLQARVAQLGVGEPIHFLGYVDDPTPLYQSAAFHVAPSIWEEPLGNVVVEAKREGTPSLILPSGGLPEMIRHQVDGFVCRDKSVEALEEGLRWMLSDPVRLQRMGVAAEQDFQARFGRERFLREWAEVYLGAGGH